jgi:DNA-binding transcriptional LysR family regulator
MVVKLDLYRIFCRVAECKSFSGAAKELYMTQPAVSQAMSQLENELGLRLFTRTPKGVSLTNDGRLLHEYISSAINLIHVGEKKLLESKELLVGELKLGVGDTASKYYLLPFLERFHLEHPNIKLRIMNRTTPELCAMLKSGEIDLGICNLPVDESSFEVCTCMDVHDIFVCGDKYHRTIRQPLSLAEVVEYPLIILETKSNSRQYVESYFQSKGIQILPEIELGSHDLLLEFARINLGLACVTKEFSQEYLKSGVLHEVPVKEPIPARSIGYCFLKSVSLSPASAAFIEILNCG